MTETQIPTPHPPRSLRELAALFEDNRSPKGETLSLSPTEQAAVAKDSRAQLAALSQRELSEATAKLAEAGLLSSETRAAWLASLGSLQDTPAVRQHAQNVGRLERYLLYSTTAEHQFEVRAGGTLHDYKVRSVVFFGEHWVYEHNLLVEERNAENPSAAEHPGPSFAEANGRIRVALPAAERDPAAAIGERPTGRSALQLLRRLLSADWWRNRRTQAMILVARRLPKPRRYAHSWLLADRRYHANDNAEVLFRHLRTARADLNAWFVLDRRAPAYRELHEKFGHIVPFGSFRHLQLLMSADIYASSQSDPGDPKPFTPYLPPSWLFVYLKHGIAYTDHHRRFNPMRLDLVLAGSPSEVEDFTAERGEYRLASSEVALTGMPRFDRLVAASQAPGEPRVLLVAPTWRGYLTRARSDHSLALSPGARESEYVRRWAEFLNSPELRAICERERLDAVFLMHPRFESLPNLLTVPDWMTLASYQDEVAPLFARTRLAVTDYSSIAFEVAYLGTPTVYFQFDREEFFAGGHSSQRGDYSYEDAGFGPVALTSSAALHEASSMLQGEDRDYASRIAAFYPQRDQRNSERAVAAIERLLAMSRSHRAGLPEA